MGVKILFITHDAERSGAQILLLQFLEWLKEYKKDVELYLLFNKKAGPLVNDFGKQANVLPFSGSDILLSKTIKQKIRQRIFLLKNKALKQKEFDIIYSNTICNGQLLRILKTQLGIKSPVITHVHEMYYWINRLGKTNFDYNLAYSNKFITVSSAAKTVLTVLNVPDSKIKKIYEYIQVRKIIEGPKKSLRQKLNIPPSSLVVGASGAEVFRKGKDLFIQLAQITHLHFNHDVHFVWIGGQMSSELSFDLERVSGKKNIHFVSHLPDANQYFHDFDVFVMISREDPFPVVNLEVACNKKPIIAFRGTGGTEELLDYNDNLLASYLDVNDLSEKLIKLLKDKSYRDEIGERLFNKVKSECDIHVVCEEIYNVILETIN